MSRLPVQFLDQGFHRTLFDAMPLPVFVVDENLCVFDFNEAAKGLVGRNKRVVLRRRGGEVLNCIHSVEAPGGCGCAPLCRDCVVRKSVGAASRGHKVNRQRARMELVRHGKAAPVDLLVTCQSFDYGRSSFVLLVLEGLDQPATARRAAS